MKQTIELSLDATAVARVFDFESVETVMDINDIISYPL